jgi:Translation initiation factor eIF3 subunit
MAEMDITESLFADIDMSSASLNLEKDYLNFGKKVSGVLYEGTAPYRIPVFFKELLKDLPKQLDSKKIKEILDSMTALYNEKVRDEKEKEKGKATKPKAAQLKAGKQHLNQQLVSDLMGDDDYGEEDAEGYERAPEKDYDFM